MSDKNVRINQEPWDNALDSLRFEQSQHRR